MTTTLNITSKKSLLSFSNSLKTTLKNTNHLLNSMQTPLAFRTHYVNAKTGAKGIEQLIVSILNKNGAMAIAGIESTNHRQIAIKTQSMFASDIIAAVRKEFGIDRYPDATILQYLSVTMFKAGIVGKIQLSNVEDKNRNCFRPRNKFYIIIKPA